VETRWFIVSIRCLEGDVMSSRFRVASFAIRFRALSGVDNLSQSACSTASHADGTIWQDRPIDFRSVRPAGLDRAGHPAGPLVRRSVTLPRSHLALAVCGVDACAAGDLGELAFSHPRRSGRRRWPRLIEF
jgi:hypothetical protein